MSQTILLTGISGFIAKRIAHDLLSRGYTVRGSLRSMGRADEVRAAVGPDGLDRLSFVELDLTRDDGWAEAMDGVDAVMHTASPFPMADPKDANDLIRPAVDGTLRALRAAHAAGVRRVVLTSSMAAVAYSQQAPGFEFGPKHWTDVNWAGSTAYVQSKTLAEQAAWAFVDDHPEIALTTVNPGLVCGTPMDQNFGTSLAVIQRILSGKDPAAPDVPFGVVDVADVSALHIAALENDNTIGQRILAVDRVMSFPQIARTVAAAYPDRKIATRIAPKLLLRIIAVFDPALKGLLPSIGTSFTVDNSASLPLLEHGFTPAPDAVLSSARYIDAMG